MDIPDTALPEQPAPALDPPPAITPAKRGRKYGVTIQISTLARRSGLTVMKIQQILRSSGITQSLSGKPLYGDQRVNTSDASAAISKFLAMHPAEAPSAPDLSAISRAAATVPAPLPAGRGDEIASEADLAAVLDRASGIAEAPTAERDFPSVPNLPAELVHHWWNVDPRRLNHLVSIGWRFVTDPKLLSKWDPSGILVRLRDPLTGRPRHMDTVLMVWPRKFWDSKNRARASQQRDRLTDALDTFRANVAETQRNLRDRYGREGDRAVGIIDEDAEAIEDRAGFAAARAAGLTQPKTMITVGKAAGKPAR